MTQVHDDWALLFDGDGFSAMFLFNAPDFEINLQKGTTVSLEFRLYNDTINLIIRRGNTKTVFADQTLIVNSVNVKEGGTLNVKEDGEIDTVGSQMSSILDYDDISGNYARRATLNQTQRFREFIPNTSNINSLVVGIRPNDAQTDQTGIWGLVQNVTDSRSQALNQDTVVLDVEVLDEFSAYSDITSLKNDLEL